MRDYITIYLEYLRNGLKNISKSKDRSELVTIVCETGTI